MRNSRAAQLSFAFALVAFVTALNPTAVRAQFATPCPGTTDVVCTNSIDISGTSFGTSAVAGENITILNSATGVVDGTDVTTTTGNATTNNLGTYLNTIRTFTVNGGNATTNDVGSASGIETITRGGGDATTINRGIVNGDIFNGTGTTTGDGNATIINYGSVTGQITNIAGANGGAGDAIFVNYGTISTPGAGIGVGSTIGTTYVTNYGKIFGNFNVVVGFGAAAILTNAGLIDGTSTFGEAINFSFNSGSATTLNILPGSRIIGNILLAGVSGSPPTTVNILGGHDISSVLNFGCGCSGANGLFDTGAPVNVFGGAPFVIFGNTVAVLDPTSFAVQDKNIADFSHTISSMVTSRLNNPAAMSGGSTPIGFAPSGNVAADMARDAFAGISSLNYASTDRVLFSNPSMTAADGTSVWAQGFVGQRIQDADAPTLRSVNNFYGGTMGVDKAFRPGFRLGALLGAGSIKSTIDLNSGDTKSDVVFGGLYGRYAMNQSFVDFALLGGHSSNDLRRTMANNLVPGGLETAAANYNGWFISPEVAYGVKMPVGQNLTLTPTARVRYLAANFGGYQESGSTTNLTVASRTSHNFEERGEVTLTKTSDPLPTQRMQISGTLGLLALQRAGDTTVNTILLGQNLPFATPGKNDVFGVYSGVGFDWRHISGWTVFGAAEYTATTDSSRTL